MSDGPLGVRPCGHDHILKAAPQRDLDGDFEGLRNHEQLRHGAPNSIQPPVVSRRERFPHTRVQIGSAVTHASQDIQSRRCFAECTIYPVDFSSDRARMDSRGFKVTRECRDSGIERSAPLIVYGRGGVRTRGVGLECRYPRFPFRDGAAQAFKLAGQ
jgi:hypothetical protein